MRYLEKKKREVGRGLKGVSPCTQSTTLLLVQGDTLCLFQRIKDFQKEDLLSFNAFCF